MGENSRQYARSADVARRIEVRDVSLGVAINTSFLLFSAFLYQGYLVRWPHIFGEFWFFALEMAAFPCLFLVVKKKWLFIGSLLGIPTYFFVLTCIRIVLNVH